MSVGVASMRLFASTPSLYTAALDLVDIYERIVGPLFITDATKNGFDREGTANGRRLHLARIMVDIQQTILDRVYAGTPYDTTAGSQFPIDYPPTDDLAGRYWKTAAYFPGHVDPPVDPAVTHTVGIVARNARIWPPNRFSSFDRDPLIRTTGFYLVPGGIATVVMSDNLVNFSGTSLFEVRVGA